MTASSSTTPSRGRVSLFGDLVLERLKDVKSLSVEEIFEVAQSYLITRVGSRELYKLLEIVRTPS